MVSRGFRDNTCAGERERFNAGQCRSWRRESAVEGSSWYPVLGGSSEVDRAPMAAAVLSPLLMAAPASLTSRSYF